MEAETNELNWNTKENRQLIEALLSLETADEAKRFLRDLLTSGEVSEFAKRLEAARMLSRDIEYFTITEKTGLSSTTIARISKWLRGSLGGYRLVLDRIAKHHHAHTTSPLGRGLS